MLQVSSEVTLEVTVTLFLNESRYRADVLFLLEVCTVYTTLLQITGAEYFCGPLSRQKFEWRLFEIWLVGAL